jgi:hypothetical protein
MNVMYKDRLRTSQRTHCSTIKTQTVNVVEEKMFVAKNHKKHINTKNKM